MMVCSSLFPWAKEMRWSNRCWQKWILLLQLLSLVKRNILWSSVVPYLFCNVISLCCFLAGCCIFPFRNHNMYLNRIERSCSYPLNLFNSHSPNNVVLWAGWLLTHFSIPIFSFNLITNNDFVLQWTVHTIFLCLNLMILHSNCTLRASIPLKYTVGPHPYLYIYIVLVLILSSAVWLFACFDPSLLLLSIAMLLVLGYTPWLYCWWYCIAMSLIIED